MDIFSFQSWVGVPTLSSFHWSWNIWTSPLPSKWKSLFVVMDVAWCTIIERILDTPLYLAFATVLFIVNWIGWVQPRLIHRNSLKLSGERETSICLLKYNHCDPELSAKRYTHLWFILLQYLDALHIVKAISVICLDSDSRKSSRIPQLTWWKSAWP